MQMFAPGSKTHVKVYRRVEDHDAEKAKALHFTVLSQQENRVLYATVLAASGSFGLSFVGSAYNLERDGGAVFSTLAAALVLSVIIGVFQVIGWSVLLDTKHYQTAWKKLGGAACAIAFLLFGYGTSSYFNYASITAPSATIIYRSDQVEQLGNTLDALRRQAEASVQLQPLIEAEERAGCSAAQKELASGIYSGSSGRGRVSGVLDGICQRASAAADAIRSAIAANQKNAAKADAILERLEELLSDTSLELLERERQITRGIRELEAIIREIRAAKMVESAEAFFKTLTTSVSALGSSQGSSFQAQQTLALQELRQGFEEREPIIRDLVAKIAGESPPDLRMDARPSVHEMMWYSVDKHPQNVLLAIGIDSFAAFMILVLLLKAPSRAKPKNPKPVERSRDIPASLLAKRKKP